MFPVQELRSSVCDPHRLVFVEADIANTRLAHTAAAKFAFAGRTTRDRESFSALVDNAES